MNAPLCALHSELYSFELWLNSQQNFNAVRTNSCTFTVKDAPQKELTLSLKEQNRLWSTYFGRPCHREIFKKYFYFRFSVSAWNYCEMREFQYLFSLQRRRKRRRRRKGGEEKEEIRYWDKKEWWVDIYFKRQV